MRKTFKAHEINEEKKAAEVAALTAELARMRELSAIAARETE